MSAEPTSGPAAGAGSICPTCKRGFPAGTRTCPHDGEELVPYAVHAAVVPRPGTGTVAMVGRGKICPTCGGRFDGAAAFCGKDGTALVLIN
jgi:predicted amidophosphoribosyltransferase